MAAANRVHIQAFFDQYLTFSYNPSAPVMSEFRRLCSISHWQQNDPARKAASADLKDAMTQQFNAIYGTDVNSLEAWQKLCVVLDVENIPDELRACRKLVKSMFVNLVDLVDTPATQVPVKHFTSEKALSKYTKKTGKFFPKETARAGGVLKFLLRQIFRPRSGKQRRGGN